MDGLLGYPIAYSFTGTISGGTSFLGSVGGHIYYMDHVKTISSPKYSRSVHVKKILRGGAIGFITPWILLGFMYGGKRVGCNIYRMFEKK